ncbi:MAG: hypothetical protein A2Y62_20100 [Candidatus Fischerbacteria bacterium RBG_13_37_8]|uniref:Serine aminopeptidase S33 domain-containing protein n=1 Tax=Candidatus Fischerbacteria bacterium RBG_13_37_8 TaxID=1817863 RepID=A0A1F5VT84_9BACT|nr:MAG: hypothetical protein A2Y62_20100 [Candidatus Fischerbacteria bacterium RBG_13_37_8]
MKIIIAAIIFLICFLFSFNAYYYDEEPYKVDNIVFKSNGYNLKGNIYLPELNNQGKAIILSHGFYRIARKHYLYKEMAERLARKGYIVISFDYRGFGQSQGPTEVKTTADLDFISDARNALDLLLKRIPEIREVIIIGHSFGAGIAMKFGVEDSRINKIICISPGRRSYELFFGPHPVLGISWIQLKINQEMKIKTKVPLDVIRRIFLPITIDEFQEISFKKPVFFIDGSHEPLKDQVFLRDYAADITAPHHEYVTIPGARHNFGVAAAVHVYDSSILQQLVDVIDYWINT